ncbi:hypothetical protein CANARDRAFT_9418 [[Candida] arabinofermentans NRRL YB-2248]|uniref:Uncharacterized protein n=1 Tax=[Candida] arabinofermentans NRRL YB-2248 TaxID=983967 RepID=A0A1E4SVT1_9ASCO|nr:hypothetical protein CANARDRAFT_9418 [[Candida] arabinofermentans NRRL YB-2248]
MWTVSKVRSCGTRTFRLSRLNRLLSQHTDKFKLLQKNLNLIHDNILKDIKNDKDMIVDIRRKYVNESIQLQSTEFFNSRVINDEFKIIDSFNEISYDDGELEYDFVELLKPNKKLGKDSKIDLSLIDDHLSNDLKFNEWLIQLSSINYGSNKNNEFKIIEIFNLCLELKSDSIELNTFLSIIKNHCERYRYQEIMKTLKIMNDVNIKPDIKICNLIIKSIIHSNTKKYKINRLIRFLEFMKLNQIKSDYLTWNIIVSGFEDVSNTLKMLSLMFKLNIPLTSFSVLERKLGLKFPIYKELKSIESNIALPIIKYSFDDCLNVMNDIPHAFEYYENLIDDEIIKEPEYYQIYQKIIYKLLFEIKNLPFTLAFLNLISKKYPDLIVNDIEIKCDIYSMLCKSMIHFKDSPNWDSLTRFFYRQSINSITGKSKITNETIENLNNVAKDLKIVGFHISNILTMFNQRETLNFINDLKWNLDKPIWEYDLNSIRFKRSCNWIGHFQNSVKLNQLKRVDVDFEFDDTIYDSWQERF